MIGVTRTPDSFRYSMSKYSITHPTPGRTYIKRWHGKESNSAWEGCCIPEHWGSWPNRIRELSKAAGEGQRSICQLSSSFWVCLRSGTSLFVWSIVNSQNIRHTHTQMEVQKHTAKPNTNDSSTINWRPSIR